MLVHVGATLSTCTGGLTEPSGGLTTSKTWYLLVNSATPPTFASKTMIEGADSVRTTTTLDMLGRKLKEQTGTKCRRGSGDQPFYL